MTSTSLSSSWKCNALAHVLETVIDYRGQSVPKSDAGVPLITARNVRDGKLDFSIAEFIHEDDYEGWMTRGQPHGGDVLFTTEAPLGNVAIFPKEGRYALGQRVVVLRPKLNEVLSGYLVQFFLSPIGKKRVDIFATGSTAKGISTEQLRKVRIDYPTLEQQREVSAILEKWDITVEKTERLIAAKENFKTSLVQQLLTGKRRLKGFKNKWKVFHLGELFSERSEREHDQLPLLSITREEGVVSRDELDRRDTSSEDKSSYLRICPGDIGYNTMRMWQGVSALSQLEGIVSPAYTICIPKEGVHGKFMAYLFKLPQVIHLFYRHSQGLTSDTWNLKFHHFAEIKVSIPSFEEQAAIAAVLETADAELKVLR